MAIHKEIISGKITTGGTLSGSLRSSDRLSAGLAAPHNIYEKDYEKLDNKPSINEVELIGNKNLEDLHVNEFTRLDIIRIWNEVWGDDD